MMITILSRLVLILGLGGFVVGHIIAFIIAMIDCGQ